MAVIGNLKVVDWVILVAYFVICIGIGLFSKLRKRGKKETAEGYFLAGRSMVWWAVGGSLFSSNIGSEHFIGLAGSGAASGIGVTAYEWQACWILLLLGFFFVPIYLRSKVFTMPEYLKTRFQSKWMRAYLTIVALISYVTTKISVDMYAGGVFLKEAAGLSIYVSAVVILTITAIYTLLGGLMAVIYTDVVQCVIMILGALALSIIGFNKIGGLSGLWDKYPMAIGTSINALQAVNTSTTNSTAAFATTVMPMLTSTATVMNSSITSAVQNGTINSCYKVDPYWNHMFRPVDDPEYPWIGIWFSLPVTGIWYWCTDQVIVQRTLGAKSIGHARAGTIVAGFLKILPLYIMVMPGMISRVLFADSVGCADPASCLYHCNNKYGCSNLAYPKLVFNILPTGVVGLMLAVMMAALMSSLSSAFNSASTIFTIDIWKRIRKNASERELLIVGRIVILTLVVIGVIWMPIVSSGNGGKLFKYIQTIQSYLAPPTCAVFLLGIAWPRVTEVAALTSMIIGLLLGSIRLIMDVVYGEPHCGQPDLRPGFVKLHFMYFAIVIFCVCVVVMVVLTFFTTPVPIDELGGLTWATIMNPRYISEKKAANYTVNCTIGNDQQLVDSKSEDIAITEKPSQTNIVLDEKAVLADYEQEKEDIDKFIHEPPLVKWSMRALAICLLCVLLIMWVYYR